jgi:hypothetical protein
MQTKEKYFPPQFVYLSYLLIAFSLYSSWENSPYNLFILLPATVIIFSFVGNQINIEGRLYRSFFSVVGLKFGKWENLSDLEYLTIYPEKQSQTMSVSSISRGSESLHFNLDLVFAEQEKKNIGTFESKEKALEKGKLLAQNLNVKLLDASEREQKWI